MTVNLAFNSTRLRLDLEQASALLLPDLEHELACCINELPMLSEIFYADKAECEEWAIKGTNEGARTARLMAIAFEAGRSYAFDEEVELTLTCGVELREEKKAPKRARLFQMIGTPRDRMDS
jgi:hypothetical protein